MKNIEIRKIKLSGTMKPLILVLETLVSGAIAVSEMDSKGNRSPELTDEDRDFTNRIENHIGKVCAEIFRKA